MQEGVGSKLEREAKSDAAMFFRADQTQLAVAALGMEEVVWKDSQQRCMLECRWRSTPFTTAGVNSFVHWKIDPSVDRLTTASLTTRWVGETLFTARCQQGPGLSLLSIWHRRTRRPCRRQQHGAYRASRHIVRGGHDQPPVINSCRRNEQVVFALSV